MASFTEHLLQSKKNLSILSKVSTTIPNSWDWQVTISFYTALHLANAHIAQKVNEHYRTHGKVGLALNPYISTNPSAFSEEAYVSYQALQNLSRRSRYLCHEKTDSDATCHMTYDKHFAKAVRHLDIIINYFSKTYGQKFDSYDIFCDLLKKDTLLVFKIKEDAKSIT